MTKLIGCFDNYTNMPKTVTFGDLVQGHGTRYQNHVLSVNGCWL